MRCYKWCERGVDAARTRPTLEVSHSKSRTTPHERCPEIGTDMSDRSTNLPPEQQAIRAKCFHPSGTFAEFPMEDVETSIPARFEKIVRMYPDRVAVKFGDQSVTYAELNAHANRIARMLL